MVAVGPWRPRSLGRSGPAAVAAALVCSTALLAGWSPARAHGDATPSVTVTFAQAPGGTPTYIFPLQPSQYVTFANDQQFGWLMYRPLYWFDTAGSPTVNPRLSLADPPRFSAGGQTVTIRLKPWVWSDGRPITTRDVAFWMNLLMANKANWGDYVPHQFPDNIRQIRYLSPSTFSITFNRAYNTTWLLYNELSQIWPIPQHVWDETSASGPVGNYDTTTSGAKAVWTFLNGQSRSGGTYDTNPLWQVVDGPWRLEMGDGYQPATGFTAMVRNPRYPGPHAGNVARLELLPFTSDTAEFDALRAGTVDFGYLPQQDLSQQRYFTGHGYRIVPWYLFGWTFLPLNFRNPQEGPIFRQLYVRQALEHLIDQRSWIRSILKGYGYPEYSPIPTKVPNRFEDAYVQQDHYPFSVAAARRLLSAHGWKVVRNGTDTCLRPGSGAGRCGVGVHPGAALSFTLQYSAGSVPLAEEAQALKSTATGAGVQIALVAHPANTVFANFFGCSSSGGSGCSWQAVMFGIADDFAYYPDYYPTGGANYLTNALFNGEGYSDSTMTRLVVATHQQSGLAAFHAYEDYTAAQLPTLWYPNGPNQISVITTRLRGAVPQGSHTEIYPETWSLSS